MCHIRFRATTCAALLVTALASPAFAQLADLQPGLNFPLIVEGFGGLPGGRSASVALGDVDNDGDLDIAFANGADGFVQDNRLHLNQGGAQGGTEGDFVDETVTRFAGLPADTSRDLAFFDMDDDGDLDLFVANRGTTVNGGEVSRVHRNLGGRQQGSVGFFDEHTDTFWGTSVSVPELDHVVVGTTGPYRSYVRDVDVVDVDDDGDLDVFVTSAGPNMNGAVDSRLWLNDGLGTVHELWPWADDLADTRWHSNEVEFVDFDDDYDIDLFASSRDSQSRAFRNELSQGQPGGRLFTDVTQTALLDTGGTQFSSNTYSVELGDFDGDGDFDAWLVNYAGQPSGNQDRILGNRGNMRFRPAATNPIGGDPVIDEQAASLIDYDGDGDLDVHISSWLGTNWLYQSSLAQSLPEPSATYHRTGTTSNGSQAPELEITGSLNGNSTNDAVVGDLDGDGDPDLAWANDHNATNRLAENALGIPDSFAPSFHQVTDQGDKSDGTATVVHAQIRDNAGMRVASAYRTNLIWSVDGGPETCARMTPQGGQQYRGVLPAALEGTVSYRVESTDDAGNTGVSATFSFVQSAPGLDPITPVGCGTEGVAGVPVFEVSGTLVAASPTLFKLRRAAPNAFAVLFLSLQSTPTPFKQGILHTVPVDLFLNRTTDAGGLEVIELPWPAFPSGLEIWMQYGVEDLSVPGAGASLSNAAKLRST